MDLTWTTPINTVVTREELRNTYGGAPYGGIEPSAKTPNVFVFIDPDRAHQNGYIFDGWPGASNPQIAHRVLEITWRKITKAAA